jgi:hypothetical protein
LLALLGYDLILILFSQRTQSVCYVLLCGFRCFDWKMTLPDATTQNQAKMKMTVLVRRRAPFPFIRLATARILQISHHSLAALGFGWAHPHKVSGMENAFGAFNSESLPCVGSVRTREVVEVGNA